MPLCFSENQCNLMHTTDITRSNMNRIYTKTKFIQRRRATEAKAGASYLFIVQDNHIISEDQ